jgi:uncharacterized membrane protein YeaQ/YmgE (transglycosylase-associated protein family)
MMVWAMPAPLLFAAPSETLLSYGERPCGEASVLHFIVWIIVGGIAGWLAGRILQGAGFGIIGNVVIGVCGAVLAGWILQDGLHIHLGTPGLVTDFIYALIGALLILVALGAVQRRR